MNGRFCQRHLLITYLGYCREQKLLYTHVVHDNVKTFLTDVNVNYVHLYSAVFTPHFEGGKAKSLALMLNGKGGGGGGEGRKEGGGFLAMTLISHCWACFRRVFVCKCLVHASPHYYYYYYHYYY